MLAELLGPELHRWNIRIFATDLDAEAIAFGRQGVYSAASVAGLPSELIARYFTVEDGIYHIRKHIRALTVFGQRAPFPRVDLVLCRNALIYFTAELQQRALQLFAYSLRDGGLLALGKAESPSPLGQFFVPEQQQLRVYRRHGERILMPSAHIIYSSPPPTGQHYPPPPGRRVPEHAPPIRGGGHARPPRGWPHPQLPGRHGGGQSTLRHPGD